MSLSDKLGLTPDSGGTKEKTLLSSILGVKTLAAEWDNFKPSTYQENLKKAYLEKTEHLLVKACAGSGKSTTLRWLLSSNTTGRVLFCAFNRFIAEELKNKLPHFIDVFTLNAVGGRLISSVLGRTLDPTIGLPYTKLYSDSYYNRMLQGPVTELAGLVRGNLLEPTIENLAILAEQHGIDEDYEVYDRVKKVLDLHLDEIKNSEGEIAGDFEDQIWLPHILDLKTKAYDIVFVDEAQDLNPAQMSLVLRLVGDGRIIVVGDENQSIYGWAGAGIDSIQDIHNTLKTTNKNITVLPLSVCYRCPKKIIELVRKTGYHNEIECAEDAIEGEIKIINIDQKDQDKGFLPYVNSDAMVLCSLNAPLVPGVLLCLRAGIPAGIKGKDASRPIRKLLKKILKFEPNNILEFLRILGREKSKAIAKSSAKDEPIEPTADIFETLEALAADAINIEDVEDTINKVFTDVGVIFSTIHKAKGTEAKTVIILRPDTLPVFWCKKDWEKKQAQNLAYVAFTRAKERLIFVESEKHKIHPQVRKTLKIMGI